MANSIDPISRSDHFEGLSRLRVAIVHYWLVNQGGGEKVLDELCELFPQADLYAPVADPSRLSLAQQQHKITTSFLQHVPGAIRWYRHYIPLYPMALENFDLGDYDVVISSESGPAKGVITRPGTCHICYCHSPMRYIWDMYPEYIRSMGAATRFLFSATAHYLRMWDVDSAKRVDHFVANSSFVQERIRKYYRRTSKIIFPPVDVSLGYISDDIQDYYLVVGRLTDYKRVDLAIEVFNRNRKPLHVVGDGPEYKRLQRMARSNVKFFGKLSHNALRDQYAHCRALIFPGEEDFGIVPVEAQSYGRPVIAYKSGGVRDSVIAAEDRYAPPELSTGIFFDKQHPESLKAALERFEGIEASFDPHYIRSNAQRFSREAFRISFMQFVTSSLERTASKATQNATPRLSQ